MINSHASTMPEAISHSVVQTEKEAIFYDDKCMLRYSNRSIFGLMEISPDSQQLNANNATDMDQFNQVLGHSCTE
ncbi:hypothetical protein glysoja_037902 [Glycine soja]|uniref:Uncharacterized protein n=1 Tax=Glycine soja TaxID=3848 RepID=A0A0B2P1M3_GLYSO|nr:hypothetical protein glysoja_037902 [Glycine soja]